ncbi:MAG: ABC transporter ATP-binding protein [Oscillospiraceae bacterium]|nr:ABC transporter ATP-binding protein [Oscillospiraceae bacterium]
MQTTAKQTAAIQTAAIQTHDLSKTFDEVVACDKISFDVQHGEIIALLGENGSGKTTLMNMLSGIYFPDSGEIEVGGDEVSIRSPKDAFDLKIGMVHQHFKLVDVFSATENIVLGLPGNAFLNRKAQAKKIGELSSRYGFELDFEKKIYDMSVSEKQTVEIIKVLYRGADILILDEPTAVLTPHETEKLFVTLRNMKEDGKAIVIITHKLNEVLAVSDRVHVLRKGKSIATVNTNETTQQELTEMMVGRAVSLSIDRPLVNEHDLRLRIEGLNCLSPDGVKALQDVAFNLKAGEILGVAGVAGSGQKELCEALSGLYPISSGSIQYCSDKNQETTTAGQMTEIVGKTAKEIKQLGIRFAFVPEDRLGMGLVANMDMTDNILIRYYDVGKGPFTDRKGPRIQAEALIEQLKIVTPGVTTPVRRLSGGNVQKILLGREIASAPRVLIVAYPVRGLDINSSYTIYDLINEQKKNGVAVLFVGEDLDVLLELADRIMVLCGGQISGIVDASATTKEQVGFLMTHVPEEVSIYE